MIRWQSRSQDYYFTDSRQNISEKNKTHVSLCVPLWGRTGTKEHFTRGDRHEIEGGLKTTLERSAFDAGADSTGTTFQATASYTRGPSQLPLVIVSAPAQVAAKTSVAKEATITGAVNATTGALLGLGAWVLGGPAGGALMYMTVGAGSTAVVTGAAQAVVVSKSNDMREFASRCNLFLVRVRTRGLDSGAIHALSKQSYEADTKAKRDLIRDIIDVCLICLGEEASVLMAIYDSMDSDKPKATHRTDDPLRFSGYSPAGGVGAAFGGR